MNMTIEMRESIINQIKKRIDYKDIAANHCVTISTVKYIARSHGVYQKRGLAARAQAESKLINEFVEKHAPPSVKKQVESNLAHYHDQTRKVTPGVAKLVLRLTKEEGYQQVNVARCLGLDQGSVSAIYRGVHKVTEEISPKRKTTKAPTSIILVKPKRPEPQPAVQPAPQPEVPLPITMIEPKPGVLRRAWRWLFA